MVRPESPPRLLMRLCFLLPIACLLSAAALRAQDMAPPQVTSISVPSPVDVTNGPQNITVTLKITDDDSGFKDGFLKLSARIWAPYRFRFRQMPRSR